MISLQEFYKIQDKIYDNFNHELDDVKYINKNILQFETFLQSNFVIRNVQRIDLTDTPLNMTYDSIIEYAIKILFQKDLFNNVLLFGLKNDFQNDVAKPFFSRTPNTCIKELQGIHWKMLHDIIGTNRFVDCLINCSVFQLSGKKWIQVIGNRANKPNAPPAWFLNKNRATKQLETVYIKTFLYKTYTKFGSFNPLLDKMSLPELRQTLYRTDSMVLTKKHRKKIDHLLNLLRKNCTKHNNYLPMLNNICPTMPIDKTTHHLDMQSSKKSVTKFVVVVLEKLIPLAMFGSKHNKSKMLAVVSDLVNLPASGMIHINDIMTKIKIKDLNFLYGGIGKKGHEETRTLFKNFALWLLSYFVPRVIKSFFYCTEVSASTLVVYFRHDVWKTITTHFIQEYFAEHLIENVRCRNHSSFLLSSYNHSRMRIIPKKANGEFRLISVPHKGIGEEERTAFRIGRMKTNLPIQAILNHIRHKRKTDFEKIDSPFQIADKLCTFKKSLLKQQNALPELHFMKFDIASCYDSIPRRKLLAVLNDLMKEETNFYVSTYTIHNPWDGRFKVKRLVNSDRKKSTDRLKIDSNQEFFFTTDAVVDAVKYELFETTLWVDDKCYFRKDGVFQGSSYSPLLVDILYDDMIQTHTQFKCLKGEQNLIIRIADDFLIISTSHEQIMNIKKLTQSGFGEYNAKVKKEKIVVTGSQVTTKDDTVLQFCGLDIDIKKLELWKSKQSLNIPLINASSPIGTYHRLIELFKLRLEYHIFNGELNSLDTIKNQIKILMENISDTFIKAFKKKPVERKAFFEFIRNIISNLVAYTSNIDFKKIRYAEMARIMAKEEFKKRLKTSKLKYQNIINSMD